MVKEHRPVAATSVDVQVPWAWSDIDIALLDMDGTLLDLRFDNYFWLELVPHRYAQAHAISLNAARDVLSPKFAACHGTLNWYCIDYWSRELGLDIAALKHEIRDQVRFLEGAERFLKTLRQWGKRLVLITNAHRNSLQVKALRTELGSYFERCTSSHDYGAAKEQPGFWQALRNDISFDSQRTLFVDDSLAVLRMARAQGIAHLVTITQPDSTLPPRSIEEFPAVRRVADLLELA
ncbi:MAG: GMP/IMP nucleotidase [Steroidobacteraceae bacterium]